VEDESAHEHRAVSDPVGKQAANNDRDAEANEASAGDGAQFGLGKAELPLPISEDCRTDGEAHSGGNERHETRQENMKLPGSIVHGRVGSLDIKSGSITLPAEFPEFTVTPSIHGPEAK
jgi:hypothetical protein